MPMQTDGTRGGALRPARGRIGAVEPRAMIRLIEEKREQIEAACRKFGVERLELFGSASRGGFDPATSDLDFLVELEPPAGVGFADAFFGLQEELEQMFGRPVDLVSLRSLRNPYFLEGIATSRRLLYAA
jgi:hypothetical protein